VETGLSSPENRGGYPSGKLQPDYGTLRRDIHHVRAPAVVSGKAEKSNLTEKLALGETLFSDGFFDSTWFT
jgi:hypothetical protein